MITNTEPQLCTKAPTTGFKMPVIANTIATKFKIMPSPPFSFRSVFSIPSIGQEYRSWSVS